MNQPGNTKNNRITPELVKKVSDKVFAMLLRELAIERDRKRPSTRRAAISKGR